MNYRREIDGLRALAVLPVIFFHAGFYGFNGGFIGVDIFFVISGYLITSIILSEQQANKFSLINFYERRARRILPALFLVMAFSFIMSWLWLLPDDMKSFSGSLATMSIFSSNIFFWRDTAPYDFYFGIDAELKPLLHTWSLAVEEQFYLLYPIFIILMWRFGINLLLFILFILFIVSLGAAEWGSTTHPSFTFYLLPTRGWELALGAFAAFYLNHQKQNYNSNLLAEIFSLIGIILIIFSIILFHKEMPLPSLYSLAPTLGAVLIILFASQNTITGKLLGSKLLVGIGLISYSAYLWHQPIFAFARHRMINDPGTILYSFLIILSLILAYLSWAFVEQPFRNKKFLTPKKVFMFSLLGTFIFLSIGITGYNNNGFVERQEFFKKVSNIKTSLDNHCGVKFRRTADQLDSGDVCMLGNTNKPPIFAIIGDSHAATIFESVNKQTYNSNYSFYAVSGGMCVPLMNGFKPTYHKNDCQITTEAAFKQILESKSIKDVILFAEWSNYTKGFRGELTKDLDLKNIRLKMKLYKDNNVEENFRITHDLNDTDRSKEDFESILEQYQTNNTTVFERSLMYTIKKLKNAGKNIIIIGPVPEFSENVTQIVGKRMLVDNLNNNLRPISYYSPKTSMKEYQIRNQEVLTIFSKINKISFIDSKEIFCSPLECKAISDDGKILYSDTNHINEYGSKLLTNKVMNYIK